ncbi:MAG: hypothetical protein ACRENU_09855 [Gemmatimonadaceae bacterium]
MKRTLVVTCVGAAILLIGWSPREFARPGLPPSADSLASPAGPGSAEPNLSVGPDGRVYLSWHEPLDSGFVLRLSSFDGRAWSAPRTVRAGRDFFVNWADFPSIEALGGGRLAAHWLQRTGSGTYAYGVRIAYSKDDGRTWSTPVTPHRDSSNTEHGFVSMWRENNGVGAAWLDGRKFKPTRSPTNEMMVVSTALDAAGAPGSEVTLDTRACDCCQTSAAMTAGGPIIAYRDRSPDEIRDVYVVRRVEGKWTEPKAVHDDNWKIAACPVNGPAVAASGDRVALAWFTAANDSPRVKLAFSGDRGATFGAPVRIDEGSPAGRVDVAMLRNGDALVSWIERTGGDTAAVRVRRVSRGGRASEPRTVAASSAARASGFPRMVIVDDRVMFAWTAPTRPSTVRVARMALNDIR